VCVVRTSAARRLVRAPGSVVHARRVRVVARRPRRKQLRQRVVQRSCSQPCFHLAAADALAGCVVHQVGHLALVRLIRTVTLIATALRLVIHKRQRGRRGGRASVLALRPRSALRSDVLASRPAFSHATAHTVRMLHGVRQGAL
jgi:hypothetical protein